METDERTAAVRAQRLLGWYDKNRRQLPWRSDPTPYHVWLSEIMLQQTRVETVKDYYARFLRELPDIESLARAPQDQYLKLWQGLGYYSRVRNMHKAAQIVVKDLGGEMPHTAAELRKLPGIGEYTSAAIASISFGEKVPAVDGNLLRIFARLSAYAENIKTVRARRAAQSFWNGCMSADRPGDFNQALMDLGSAVCLPGAEPLCGECPFEDNCLSHKSRTERKYPVMPEKSARKVQDITVFLIWRGEKAAIRRRPDRGLLAGMYEFPNTRGALTQKEALSFLKKKGMPAVRIRALGTAVHVFSHIEWHMTGYEIRADELARTEGNPSFLYASPEEISERYAVPSAFSAWMKYLWK